MVACYRVGGTKCSRTCMVSFEGGHHYFHYLHHSLERKKESEVAQSCPTLCNPMNCSLSGSSIHGIFQARVLEWVSISFSTIVSFQFSSVAQSCMTLCNPMNCSMPALPVHHQLPEFTQTHVYGVGNAIQLSHPLLSPSPPAPNPS